MMEESGYLAKTEWNRNISLKDLRTGSWDLTLYAPHISQYKLVVERYDYSPWPVYDFVLVRVYQGYTV